MANYADRRAWALTAAEAKLDELKKQQATADQINKIYRSANKQIQARVQALYDELATQDPQNRWRFEGLNTPAKLKSAEALRKKIESAGLTDYVPERLQRRLSVYEVMELDNWYTMTKAGQDAHSTLKKALEAKIKDQGEIWQRALGAGGAGFVGFDRNQVGYMLGENWYGGNFSSRLWDENQAAWKDVQEEIAKALASGQDPATTRRKLANILGPAYKGTGPKGINYAVERIMRTEMARAATQADIIKWQSEGVDEVQWNARLESNTCEHCKERDGRVYKIKQARDSVPLHPNCRCFLTPYDRTAEEARDDRVRQYKDENGEYQQTAWAPMSEFEKGTNGYKLAAAVLHTADYFMSHSPWTTYEPARTGINYKGDITYTDGVMGPQEQAIVNLTENSIQAATDKYPEIMDEIKRSFDNTITLRRGYPTREIDGKIFRTAGFTRPKTPQGYGHLEISYPYKKGQTATQMLEELAKNARKEKTADRWSTGKVNHAINHELGHTLAYNLRWRGGNLDDVIIKAAGSKNLEKALTKIGRYVSKGAKEDVHEAFAELFAKSMDQDATDSSKIVANFVKALNEERAKFPKQEAPTRKIKV